MTSAAVALAAPFRRLVRFISVVDSLSSSPPSFQHALVGEPVRADQDVGLASRNRQPIEVDIFSGASVLSPGRKTGERAQVERLLSPLSATEVGTIRCIGLNYVSHAKEVNMPLPDLPTLFMKPCTALGDPFPAPTILPRAFATDDAADFEAEVAVVIGKSCKDVSESDALQHVLGITASNDVSSRKQQFAQSQWSYSKSFDSACPLGPALVHVDAIDALPKVTIAATLNGERMQESSLVDQIFSIPRLVSFLSRGTTLLPGTVILTGTPAGVGMSRSPPVSLKGGDEFRVFISHGVGTLVNEIQQE